MNQINDQNELRKLIYQKLSTITPTYSNYADAQEESYCTYYLNNIDVYWQRSDVYLTIDVIDPAISAVEATAQQIRELLDQQTFNTATVSATFYFESQNVVDESDKGIQHRNMRFSIMAYSNV